MKYIAIPNCSVCEFCRYDNHKGKYGCDQRGFWIYRVSTNRLFKQCPLPDLPEPTEPEYCEWTLVNKLSNGQNEYLIGCNTDEIPSFAYFYDDEKFFKHCEDCGKPIKVKE